MQYMFDGELYKIVKITGPKHNMLALGFGESSTTIEVTDLDKTNKNPTKVLSSNVAKQVSQGIKEINQEFKTTYKIIKIQFVGSDTPSDTVYVELTKKIIKRLQAGEPFVRI